MAIDFPNSPALNDYFESSGKAWTFNGTSWDIVQTPANLSIANGSITAPKLASGVAVANIGYTPANVASPTFTGAVVLPSTTSIGDISSTELSYVDGVTSAIQTQLNAKAPSASPTFTGTVTVSNDLTVTGNLTVNGTNTILNTETLSIEDNIIVLNSNVSASPILNAGIEVERGTSSNVLIRWNETNGQWEFTNDGTTYGDIAALGTIELGTDTTGNFVSDITQGTGVTVTHTPGEGSSPTVAIGQSVATSASVTFANVTANLIGNVTGNASTVTNGIYTSSSINALADVDTVSASPTSGQFLKWNGTNWVPDSVPTINALDDIGNVSASAPTSGDFLKWNGSAWVNDAVDLGTDTTGNYMSDLTQGTGVTITHTPGEGSNATIAIGQSVATSASVTFASVTAPLVGNVTGNVTGTSGSTTGNAATATTLENARTISIGGDVSGSVSFNGSSDVSISATIQPDSVALGTDTTGNYMSDLTQGTGVTITHTPGEGSNATIAIGQGVGTSASVSFAQLSTSGDLTVGGNLTVNGTTTTLNTETLSIEDNIIVLNNGVTGSPTTNAGIEVERGTSPNVVIRWNETSDNWEFTDDGSTYYDIASEDFVTSLAVSTLDDLSNVSASAPADGEFLKYVSASSVWVPASIPTINALDDIGDVSASVASPGQFLKWNGTAWVPETIIGGATISDSAPAGPLAGQLWFDSTVGKTFVYYDSQWIEVGGVGTGARMVSSSSAPASPLEGSMWFDTDTAQTFVYYDSSWIEIGASGITASVQDSAPAAPVSGQIWFNSLTGGTYVYYGTNWVEVGASPFSALVNTINAKGDLLVGTADNTIGGLGVGSANQVLTVDSSTATGLKWATPVSTGKAIAMSIVFGG